MHLFLVSLMNYDFSKMMSGESVVLVKYVWICFIELRHDNYFEISFVPVIKIVVARSSLLFTSSIHSKVLAE